LLTGNPRNLSKATNASNNRKPLQSVESDNPRKPFAANASNGEKRKKSFAALLSAACEFSGNFLGKYKWIFVVEKKRNEKKRKREKKKKERKKTPLRK
jgi:hypothetical protein